MVELWWPTGMVQLLQFIKHKKGRKKVLPLIYVESIGEVTTRCSTTYFEFCWK